MREPCFKMIWYLYSPFIMKPILIIRKHKKNLAFAIFYQGRVVKQDAYTIYSLSNELFVI
jgi:hypothetical protein